MESAGIWASLLGGIGLFLLGMQMMTAGLTQAAGPALRSGLEFATRSRLRAFAVGTGITALTQSSSAVTVASIGFANAGLVSFANLVWVIYGTSLGNTMTGWIVALMGAKFSIGALALPFLGLGMIARLLLRGRERAAGLGEALAGFGAFFLGIGTLQVAFSGLTPQILALTEPLAGAGWERPAFVGLGIAITLLTQSSSATITLVLGAAAGGALGFSQAAALIIGASIGTTSTAAFAAIGATSAAKRIATSHVAFNIFAGGVAVLILPILAWLCLWLVGGEANIVTGLALFHTLYILIGALVMIPLNPVFLHILTTRFRAGEDEIDRPRYVDATLSQLPELALRALALEFSRLLREYFALARARVEGQALPPDALADLASLGERLRDQLAEVGRNPLPPAQVAVLSDGLRVLIWLDEMSRQIAALAPPPKTRVQPDEAALAREVMVLRDLLQIPVEPALRHRLEARVADARTAYEQIKTDLLDRMAHGAVDFREAEQAINHGKALSDLAVLVAKIQSVLIPWLDREQLAGAVPGSG